MTETELRSLLVETAKGWLGRNEKDGSHREIIDLYNSHTPLARGYKIPYTGAWCATFVSACAIAAGLTDIIPTEVSCGRQIALFQKLGSWVEEDAYIPKPGDILYYDWDDDGKGETTGWPEHVGIVAECDGEIIRVIEGNYKDAVGIRTVKVNGRYLRGFGVPDYGRIAQEENAAIPARAFRVATKRDPLNIRSGVGTGYPVLAEAEKGTVLLGRDTFDGWIHVAHFAGDGKVIEGWAFEKYLELMEGE